MFLLLYIRVRTFPRMVLRCVNCIPPQLTSVHCCDDRQATKQATASALLAHPWGFRLTTMNSAYARGLPHSRLTEFPPPSMERHNSILPHTISRLLHLENVHTWYMRSCDSQMDTDLVTTRPKSPVLYHLDAPWRLCSLKLRFRVFFSFLFSDL